MPSRWLLLALLGAFLCTVGDHLHATLGVLTYPQVAFWGQAWWVAPLFGGATLACVIGARPFLAWGGATERAPMHRLLADLIGFLAAYAYTSFADHARPNVTLAVLAIAFGVRVLAEARPMWLIAYALGLAVVGSLFEGALSATGAFHYLRPDFLGIPRWLPGIYLHAGLIAGELAVWMRR